VNGEITPLESESSVSGNAVPNRRQIYVMESTCPHLGADLSHAEIEECESSVVAVCPWHRFVYFILFYSTWSFVLNAW
jgi:nitrite reductase/ring-hydroxylating ferredoxin subunit